MDEICKSNHLWAQRATQTEGLSILALHSHLTALIPYPFVHGPPFGRAKDFGGDALALHPSMMGPTYMCVRCYEPFGHKYNVKKAQTVENMTFKNMSMYDVSNT
jgi:hypothetical protein